jgi:hypothetical protein
MASASAGFDSKTATMWEKSWKGLKSKQVPGKDVVAEPDASFLAMTDRRLYHPASCSDVHPPCLVDHSASASLLRSETADFDIRVDVAVDAAKMLRVVVMMEAAFVSVNL